MKGIFEHVWKIRQRIDQKDWGQDRNVKLWLKNKNHNISKWWRKGITNIDDVLHGFITPKNKSLKWYGNDNLSAFNQIEDHKDFTTDNVTYTLNAHGYRGDNIDDESDFTVLVVGCSHTFGIGLDDTQCWPYHLKEFLKQNYKNPKVINAARLK